MRMTVAEVVAATGGTLLRGEPEASFSDATQDSRRVEPGMLFIPVKGDRDGHDFIGAALAAGAAGYLTSQAETESGTATGGHFAVGVADTLNALADLGRYARDRVPAVAAITGSAGKTTTKD